MHANILFYSLQSGLALPNSISHTPPAGMFKDEVLLDRMLRCFIDMAVTHAISQTEAAAVSGEAPHRQAHMSQSCVHASTCDLWRHFGVWSKILLF